jgi:hypothetical protein
MLRAMHAAVAVLICVVAGCAGPAPPPPIVPAEGVVRLQGKPLAKVEVRFIPMIDHGPEYIAKGVTDEKGRFTLSCNGQGGACACENRVLIMEAELPARLRSENAQAELAKYFEKLGGRPLPPQYQNLVESPLVANVTETQKSYTFELKR